MDYYGLYWINSYNFGDALNADLYRFITGRPPRFTDLSPKILAMGSIMNHAMPGDIVWGTGCIADDAPIQADKTTDIITVRGPLSAKKLKEKGVEVPDWYGSPATLMPKYYHPTVKKEFKVGIIPHYIDIGKLRGYLIPSWAKVINQLEKPLQRIKEIMRCDAIISSSLHGIIIAEAYGIPAIWAEFSDLVRGGGFKFRDYYKGTGRDVDPVDFRKSMDLENLVFVYPPIFDTERLLKSCPFNRQI